MDTPVYLGIDIGSSSVRTAAFDEAGHLLHIEQKPVTLISTAPGEAVLDPRAVVSALADTMKACAAKFPRIRAAGFDAIMHSILLADETGQPVTHALTWGDTRAAEQAQAFARNPKVREWSRRTGCYLSSPIYPAAKAAYLRETLGDVFTRSRILTLKQYILHELFGTDTADWSDAASMGLFDLSCHDWDEEILRAAGIRRDQLSPAAPPDTRLPAMKKQWLQYTGIPSDTVFCLGTTDGVAANTGCGVFDSTQMSCTIGTTGAVRTCMAEVPPYAGQELWCYSYLPGVQVTGAAISNGGIALQQVRKLTGLSYRQMDEYAAAIAPGCEGLTFIPTFLGERSPDYNAHTTGAMRGMQLHHTAGHLARAVMEGVLYRLYDNYLAIREKAPDIRRILANGGYAKSPVWMQMQADLFGSAIAVAGAPEAASLGAAYLGMIACGDIAYGDVLPAMTPSLELEPDLRAHEAFAEGYARYREFYQTLYGGCDAKPVS